MSSALRIALTLTDGLFIAYWTLAVLSVLGWVTIPDAWLYAEANNPRVVAWNWSFFPLDIAFSVTGILAIRYAGLQHSAWRPWALISLVLTMVAGTMAVGYWTLLQEFDWLWFLPNLALMLWPLAFLPQLISDMTNTSDATIDSGQP